VNALDRAILAVAPVWGARRLHARAQVMAYRSAYDAAQPGRLRQRTNDFGSGNAATASGALAIRTQARHLDRNHDLVVGGLNTLVQNVFGPSGIGVEPQPRDANGDVSESLVDQITPLYRDWCRRPEVTWGHDFGSVQRLLGRTLFRDGECLHQDLIGPVPYLDHGTTVPYSIEMIEPDLLPLDLSDPARRILQGVERNAWGRAVAYWLYRQHPGDPDVYVPDTKRVPADLIRHAKLIDRIGQVRGVSLLASVLTRLEDLKDYEESERIAAKIAACMAAFIIKGDPTLYGSDGNGTAGYDAEGKPLPARNMRMEPGMVFDTLRPGESVGTIDTKRPNANLEPYRNGQLRATAAGMRVSFSSLSKNYNGTYSAQRQELVEQYGAYGVLAFEAVAQIVRPIYERFIAAALASGELVLPAGTPVATLTDALYLPPSMPWIDPKREAEAFGLMEERAYMSGPEIIRRRGANPRDVLDQQSAWLERKREWGIPGAPGAPASAPVPATNEEGIDE
jgi:lambda family phage portal protein